MTEISMGMLRLMLRQYISDHYETQGAFAKVVGVSVAYVSAVLCGRSAVPGSWASLVGAQIETRITISDDGLQMAGIYPSGTKMNSGGERERP